MKCNYYNRKSEKQKGYLKGVEDTVDKMSIIILYVLADKYGFGHKKLEQVAKSLTYASDSVVKGLVSIEDYEKVLKDEYDIEIIHT